MAFIIGGNFAEVVKEAVFDHEQPFIGENARFTTFLYYF
jgi:hypothetical protein